MRNDVGIVLAAGFGSRLRPATLACPKPLLPVAGVEPLFSALERLRRDGIKRVVVNAHHLAERVAEKVESWGRSHFSDLDIRLSVETPAILGSGGGVLKILQENRDWAKGSRALILNGDTLTDLEPTSLLESVIDGSTGATFSFSQLPLHLERYGPIWIGSQSEGTAAYRGVGSQSRPSSAEPAHFLGTHALSPTAIEELLDSRRFVVREVDLFSGIYEPLMKQGLKISGIPYAPGAGYSFWFDLNTPEFLLEAQSALFESLGAADSFWRRCLVARHPGVTEVEKGVWVRGTLPAGLRPLAPSLIAVDELTSDAGAAVGPNASLVGAKGNLPARCRVRNTSLLFDDSASSSFEGQLDSEVVVSAAR